MAVPSPKRLTAALILPLLAGFPLAARPPEEGTAAPRTVALRAARIHTVSGEIIRGATILVRDGKIVALGTDVELPEGVPVEEFPNHTIIPGLVAPGATLGTDGTRSTSRSSSRSTRSFPPSFGRSRSGEKSLSPEALLVDSFDLYADLREVLAGGVTTLGVTSESSRLLSGRGLVVKTSGHAADPERRILRRAGGVRVTLGERSKRPPPLYEPPVPPSTDRPFETTRLQPPVSRGGALLALGKLLEKARVYRARIQECQTGAGTPPPLDLESVALQDLLDGKDYLHVRVDRAHDILRLLEFARAANLRVVLEGAREACRVEDWLASGAVPVIVDGTFRPALLDDRDLARSAFAGDVHDGLAASLLRAGVPVALRSPANGASFLLYQAVDAVRHGLSPGEALRAITLTPAEILGVAGRVGSLEPGKDADLVVLGGDPFRGRGRPVAVYIEGERVYPAAPRVPEGVTVIRCGRILTVTRGEIEDGLILVRDGKIVAVNRGPLPDSLPPGTRVIDASSETVIPGLIDTGSKLGVHVDEVVPSAATGAGAPTSTGGGKATFRIADAIDPEDPQFADVLRAGITTVVLTPDTKSNVAGQLTAMKLARTGEEAPFLIDPAGLLFGSVSSSVLDKAKKYHDQMTAHEKAQREKEEKEKAEKKRREAEAEKKSGKGKEGKAPPGPGAEEEPAKNPPATPPKPTPAPPARNEEYDVLRPLFDGKIPAVVQAPSDSAVKGILTSLTDKYSVKTLVFGATEYSDETLEELRRRDVGILLGTRLILRKSLSEIVHLPRRLTEKRLRFAFRSEAGSGSRQLPVQVAYAVHEGWEEREALRAMTLYPAQFFGLDHRLGSIEAERDADLVFLDGDPFSMTSRVTRVMVNGTMVLEEALARRAK